MGNIYGYIKRYHFSKRHYQRSCDSFNSTPLVIIILLNKVRLGKKCPSVLGKMLISTFIHGMLTKHINMYFLKQNKQIYFNDEQVKASGEFIQEQGKSKLVCWFQQTYSIRSVLPACHFGIDIFWEVATQLLSQQSQMFLMVLAMNSRCVLESWGQ